MAYEADYAGIGVGKTWGVKAIGGVAGSVRTAGKEAQLTFEFQHDTVDQPYSVAVPHDYLVTELTLYVEEAFGAGATADISIDGGAGLTTDLDLNTVGVSKPSTAGLGNLSGSKPATFTLDLSDAQTQAAETGRATLVVTYERI